MIQATIHESKQKEEEEMGVNGKKDTKIILVDCRNRYYDQTS